MGGREDKGEASRPCITLMPRNDVSEEGKVPKGKSHGKERMERKGKDQRGIAALSYLTSKR